jgi:MinD superfamily P-loop ATPase
MTVYQLGILSNERKLCTACLIVCPSRALKLYLTRNGGILYEDKMAEERLLARALCAVQWGRPRSVFPVSMGRNRRHPL